MGEVQNPEPYLSEIHQADLRSSGLTLEQILVAGHVSADRITAQELVGYNLPGLIFGYCDPDGQPYKRTDGKPFYRIKPNWGDRQTEESPKYLSPEAQGCRPYFSRLYLDWPKAIKSTRIDLWETEGEKKGDCACLNGLATIAFAGVDAWVDRCDRETGKELVQPRILPELSVINWHHRKVYQCFDSDIIEKIPVQLALLKRAVALQEVGAFPFLVLLPNEIDGSKNGLDDFIVRHGIEALRLLAEASEPTLNNVSTPKNRQNNSVEIFPDFQEPESHYKAVMAWSVLKEIWAYLPGIGWYNWQKTHWILKTEIEFEADLTRFMDAQRWKKRSSSLINSVMREVKSRLLVKESCWNHYGKLAFQNGTLNVLTHQFTPTHNPHDFLTQLRPYEYNQTAKCPTWLQFLKQAMGGEQDLIDLIQAIFRYTVLPRPKDRKAEIEKSFDFFGEKGTGKGTTLDVLTNLVGFENVGSASVDTFKSPVGLGQLIDKTVAIDYDASGFLRDVGAYNRVVSNEPVEVKKLYENRHTTRLGVAIIRAYNKFVSVPDGSEGLDRRLTIIPFNHKPTEIDTDLSLKLEAELPGIFAWCCALNAAEMKQRILSAGQIQAIAEVSTERFETDNPEFSFLMQTFPEGANDVKTGDLYKLYGNWCRENGYPSKTLVKFTRTIKSFGCQRSKGKSNGCYHYTIPNMSNFDVSTHLGIVSRQLRDSFRDSSNPSVESNRDSCRHFNKQNQNSSGSEESVVLEYISEELEEDIAQLSTTISNPVPESDSTVSEPSLTVSRVHWKIGDRIEAFRDGTWYLGTLTQIPNSDPNPCKKISSWRVKLDKEVKESYVWQEKHLRKA
jgi:putative DNA primase/helicase